MQRIRYISIEIPILYHNNTFHSSDLPAIEEMCQNVYGGSDYLHLQFTEYLQDKSTFVYGVEHKETGQMVSTQLIIIQDGGVKASLKGNRTQEDHRKKGLNSFLQQYAMADVQRLVPHLRVFEATTYSDNIASIKSQRKNGLNAINIKYAWLQKEASDKLESLLDTLGDNAIAYKSYKSEENILRIVDILGNKYHRKQILFDWIIHKIDVKNDECMKSVVNSLTKEFKLNRFRCIMNSDESVLCLINVMAGTRSMLQFHFYCEEHVKAESHLLSMIQYLYSQWKTGANQLYKGKRRFRVFLDKDVVVRDERLCQLFNETEPNALFKPSNRNVIILSNDENYYD